MTTTCTAANESVVVDESTNATAATSVPRIQWPTGTSDLVRCIIVTATTSEQESIDTCSQMFAIGFDTLPDKHAGSLFSQCIGTWLWTNFQWSYDAWKKLVNVWSEVEDIFERNLRMKCEQHVRKRMKWNRWHEWWFILFAWSIRVHCVSQIRNNQFERMKTNWLSLRLITVWWLLCWEKQEITGMKAMTTVMMYFCPAVSHAETIDQTGSNHLHPKMLMCFLEWHAVSATASRAVITQRVMLAFSLLS